MPFFGVPIRNGLPIGLGSVAGFGVQQFDPSQLFSAGEQGFFYDPSDLSTLFQDSAGTTPVTGVEQVVGLMLDKSKGLVLGAELVTNGDFSSGTTGWSALNTATISESSGRALVNATAAFSGIQQTLTTVIGRWYVISLNVELGTSLAARAYVQNSVGPAVSSIVTTSGVKTLTFIGQATTTGMIVRADTSDKTGTFFVDNVSVRELPGNHATSTGAARPTLSARVNLLTKTEQFDDGVWTKAGSISQNAITAPDGTLTADKLISPSGTVFTRVRSDVVTGAVQITLSASFKIGEWRYGYLLAYDTQDNIVHVDLQLGTIVSTTAGCVGSIFSQGDGWYRVNLTRTSTAATVQCFIGASNSATQISWTGDGTSGIYIWGADLRATNDGIGIPAYQRVNTATDYDSSGFPLYLRFGGTQAMSTGSINFTATDKMSVFAGVRKLSDAATGIVTELSASNTNNGMFFFCAPFGASANYQFRSKGTLEGTASSPASYSSPITSILTGLGDISGDSAILRVNGTQVAQSTADQGTGNYGNHPLYIGARNLASLFLNGRIYSLIGVGSAVSAGNISATESWVNGKTKAY